MVFSVRARENEMIHRMASAKPWPSSPRMWSCGTRTLRRASAPRSGATPAAALVWVVNLGCIDLNPHPIRADDTEHNRVARVRAG